MYLTIIYITHETVQHLDRDPLKRNVILRVHLSVFSCLLWHLNGEDTEQMYSKHPNVSIIRQTVNFINTPQYLHTGYIGCLHEMEI